MFKSFNNDFLLDSPVYLFDVCLLCSDLDNFFSFDFNLSELLNQDWNLNNFLNNSFDILIDLNDLRYYFFNFNNFRNIHSFLDNLLHLIHLGNLGHSINDFFDDLLDFFDLLNDSFNRDNFLSESLNFNNSILKVGYYFLHFLNSLLDNNVVNLSLNLNHLDLFLFDRDNSVSELINLLYLSVNYFDRDHFLNNSINRDLNLNWYYNVPVYLNYLWLFNYVCNNLLDL